MLRYFEDMTGIPQDGACHADAARPGVTAWPAGSTAGYLTHGTIGYAGQAPFRR
jgi:hypothetical protein